MRPLSAGVPVVQLVLIALVVGCAPDTGPAELAFAVDPALLGEGFHDESQGLVIRPPAGWEPIGTEVAEGDASPGDPRTLAVFRSPTHGGSLSVSRYDRPSAVGDRGALVRARADELRGLLAGGAVLPTEFTYHGYRVTQILAFSPDQVVWTLFAERPGVRLFRLDYDIPRSSYADELRSLESSIGSLDSTRPGGA